MTVGGWVLLWINYFLIIFYVPTGVEVRSHRSSRIEGVQPELLQAAPMWVYPVLAVNHFAAYALDCLDGKQVRLQRMRTEARMAVLGYDGL